MSSPKNTKAQQTAQTRRAILDRARRLFALNGYAATGTEALISDLGITRGALYHQFSHKKGVFHAVIEEVFLEISDYVQTQASPQTTSWQKLIVGCHAYLDIAQQEDIRRLLFIEAPAVLGPQTLNQLDRKYGYGLLIETIETLANEGQLQVLDVEGFATMVNGALEYLAAWTIQEQSPERLATAKLLAERLLILHRQS